MRTYFGPANGALVKEGILHCFIALETTGVLHETTEAPGWNQLHVSDDWNVAKDVDWDTIYSDLFRREFSRELDSVLAEFPPFGEHCTEYIGKLVPDLCVR